MLESPATRGRSHPRGQVLSPTHAAADLRRVSSTLDAKSATIDNAHRQRVVRLHTLDAPWCADLIFKDSRVAGVDSPQPSRDATNLYASMDFHNPKQVSGC